MFKKTQMKTSKQKKKIHTTKTTNKEKKNQTKDVYISKHEVDK